MTTAYFTVGVDNAPLHALASGVDGLNGIYKYNATSIFPSQSTKTSNYWVDVVFNTSSAPGANTLSNLPPTVGANSTAFTDYSLVREYPNPWRSNVHSGKDITF